MPLAEDVLVSLIQARALEGPVPGILRADIHTLHVSCPSPFRVPHQHNSETRSTDRNVCSWYAVHGLLCRTFLVLMTREI